MELSTHYTRTDDMATGSARSVSGFDVYKAIEYLSLIHIYA